jgi:hypothetical protein
MLWLLQADPRQTMYVNRLGVDGRPIKPYLIRCTPYADLFVDLQAIHGGGELRILIREGRTMVVSADVAIEPLPRR